MDGLFAGTVSTNGTTTISDTFVVEGWYCTPTTNPKKHKDALQILVHGATYNKAMWSGYDFEFGDRYNWHAYANAQGYHTLAIDRLGHGDNPQRPDPLSIVQLPLNVEIEHSLIETVRGAGPSTTANPLGRAFGRVAHVGHSYGSMIGVALARLHPGDADALVLTGWSTSLNTTALQDTAWASASLSEPSRFAGLPLEYITTSSEAGRESGFFYPGFYDPAVPPVDFARRDTATPGEVGTFGPALRPAPGFVNAVMAASGAKDGTVCTYEGRACEAILEDSVGDYFPNASGWEVWAPANTGHDLTLHYSAPETFERVHAFLERFL